jgi:hypothetical protein
MELLSHLWMPILASAAAVWIASAVIWMALPHHHKDWGGLPNEDAFRDFVKSAGIAPGNYGFPYFSNKKDCHTPEGKARWESGPIGMLNVWGKISMGRNMLLTFIVNLVVSVLIGYLASVTVPPGAACGHVFQVTATAGILAYCFAFLPNGIWFGQKPRALAMNVIDGMAYGLITGAIFAWLWPATIH